MKGGRKGSGGGKRDGGRRGRKKKCFAWLQSKRGGGGQRVFSLTPGSGGDRRLVRARAGECAGRGCLCVCARHRGAHPSAFPGDAGGRGRRPWWLVKSSPRYRGNINCAATAKEIRARCKVTMREKQQQRETKSDAEMRGGRGGWRESGRRKIDLFFFFFHLVRGGWREGGWRV